MKILCAVFVTVFVLVLTGCASAGVIAGSADSFPESDPNGSGSVVPDVNASDPEPGTENITSPPAEPVTRELEDGRDYHVDGKGDDANPGSETQPWRTLQYAVDQVQPGDVISVHNGTYDEEVQIAGSGTAASPITLQRFSNDSVSIRSIEFAPGASYYRIDGCSITGYEVWGITLYGNNSGIHLSGLDIGGGEAGIRLTVGGNEGPPESGPVSNITVEDCVIHDCIYAGIDGTPGPCNGLTLSDLTIYGIGTDEGDWGADGLAIARGTNITVENCAVHDNAGDGIDLNPRDDNSTVENIVVANCSVFRNYLNGVKLWAGGRLEGNVIWGMGDTPVVIGAYNCSAEVIRNTIAFNNYDPAYSVMTYSCTIGYPEPDPADVNLTLVGNIVAFNTGPKVGEPAGILRGSGVRLFEERDNVFFSREDEEILAAFIADPDNEDSHSVTRAEINDGTWMQLSGQGSGDISVDPQFVSGWPDVDLHLQPGSPGAGSGVYPGMPSNSSSF